MARKTNKPNQSLKIPKIILIAGKLLSLISEKLTVSFAAKLFITPIKHKIPKRELAMDHQSRQETIVIPSIDKKVTVYHFGETSKRVLLVHGWSGRGTQLVKFADELITAGYSTVSFDAPAHGKSPGKTTLLPEFIETVMELDRKFGPFEAAIGHSLGGMALLNAVKNGLLIKHLAIIGSADIIKDITDDFVRRLELAPKFSDLLQRHFEYHSNLSMNSFSASVVAKAVTMPVLIVHDENDDEVPLPCALNIHQNLNNSQLMITKNLGHRKILGDQKVISKVLAFINQKITVDALSH